MSQVHVQLLVVDDCPNEEAASRLLRCALNAVGLRGTPVHTTVVRSAEEAAALQFVGSPTVRINGVDVVDAGGLPSAVACRVYQTAAGRAGTPDLQTLTLALERHACTG